MTTGLGAARGTGVVGLTVSAATPAVEYRGVTFSYGGENPALENVTLSVNQGERLGILGPNGGGKSTLLKITLGLLDGYAGEVRVLGKPPRQARAERLLGYVPQKIEAELAFPLTVRQVVEMGLSAGFPAWRGLSAAQKGAVTEALRVVGAEQLAGVHIGSLSGGQLQRVMIARALAPRPRVLLLDEPTVGIDVAGQQQFAELLAGISTGLGTTVIVVSHDLRTVAAGCDRVACLSRTLHAHTAPSGLTPAVLAEVFRHDVAGIFGDVHVDAHAAGACCGHEHGHVHGGKRAGGAGGEGAR